MNNSDTLKALCLRAREDAKAFCELMLASELFDVHPHEIHDLIHESLAACAHEGRHCTLVLPPEHGKTSIVAPWLVWMLGHNPRLRVGLVSANERLNKDNLIRIRKILCNDLVRSIFPSLVPDTKKSQSSGEWSKEKLYMSGNSFPSFTVYPFYGAAEGARMDIIWLDDAVTRECQMSEAERIQAHQTIHGTWLNRITNTNMKGFAIFTNNVWHREDPIHKMLDSPAFHVLWVGYNDTTDMYWRVYHPVPQWKRGAEGEMPLWEAVWSQKRLMEKLSGDRLSYKRLYGGKAMLAEDCRFGASDTWPTYTLEELQEAINNGGRFYAFLDPNGGKKIKQATKRGDYAAIVIVLIDQNRTVYLVDCWVRRGVSPLEQISELGKRNEIIFRLFKHPIHAFRIEVLPKDSEWIMPNVLAYKKEQRAAGNTLNIVEWNPPGNVAKEVFIDGLVSKVQNAFVRVPWNLDARMKHEAGQDWRALVNQMEDFPMPGSNDDGPDAFSKAVVLAEELGPVPTRNPQRDEERAMQNARAARAEDIRTNTLPRRENDGSWAKERHSGWRI